MGFTSKDSEDLIQQICLTVRGNVDKLIQAELQHTKSEGLKEILNSGESSALVRSIREKLRNGVAQRSADLLIYIIAFKLLCRDLSAEEFREYANKMLSCIEKVVAH